MRLSALYPAIALCILSSTTGCRGCDDPTASEPAGESAGSTAESSGPAASDPEGSSIGAPETDGSSAAAPGQYPLREAIMEAREAQDAGTSTGSQFNPRQRLQSGPRASSVRQLNPEARQRLLERRLRNGGGSMSTMPNLGNTPRQLRLQNRAAGGSGEGAPGPYNMRVRQAREL